MPEPPAKVHEFVMGLKEKSPGKAVGGSDRDVFNNAMISAVVSTAWAPVNATPEQRDKLIDIALIGLLAFKPEDEIEGMLAAQAMAMHHGAMESARRAMIPDQGFESGVACRKAAVRYSRAFIDLLTALDRKRGKGYFKTPFVLDGDGCVAVPQGPGLGVELDEDGLEQIMSRPWRVERG